MAKKAKKVVKKSNVGTLAFVCVGYNNDGSVVVGFSSHETCGTPNKKQALEAAQEASDYDGFNVDRYIEIKGKKTVKSDAAKVETQVVTL
jgi:hypothetical protein